MKKLFLAALGFTAMTTSAQKLEIADLPAPSLTFIEKHFPGVPVTKIKKDSRNGDKGYKVSLSDGTDVEFDSKGSYREVDGHDKAIPTEFIDTKIVEYVNRNYPKNKITHIEHDRDHIEVNSPPAPI